MKYFLIVVSIFILFGCSTKNIKVEPEIEVVKKKKVLLVSDDKLTCKELTKDDKPEIEQLDDLVNLPQNVEAYLKNIDNNISIYAIQNKYEKYYFRMWNKNKPQESLKSVKWPFSSYCVGRSYGANLKPLKQSFFDNMLRRSNFDNYAKLNLKAITLKEISLRSFPTNKPLFKNPTEAGEGFPFDYIQNSTVHMNKPILVSHYSKDKEWAYVFSSFTSGWIKRSEFVVLDKKYTDIWQKAQQIRITKEDVSIYKQNGKFLFKTKIGMLFALVDENKDTYTVLTVQSSSNHNPIFVNVHISKNIAQKDILELNSNNLKTIINEVSKTNYGWGGLYGQRDCSSMLRDLYAPFGIWLPRNSSQQAKVGKIISFKDLNNDEKISLIKDKAIPFQTLLYKKGHIVLYLGTYNDEVIVFHNTWGIKTKKDGVEGRYLVGKPVYSTLQLGKNLKDYDKSAEILRNLKSMNILTQ